MDFLPTHEDLMLPILKILGDKKSHTLSELSDLLSKEFEISPEQRKILLPSGKYPMFRSRVSWAKTYMGKAGLLETPKKANYKITQRGVKLLKENPPFLNKSALMRYPSFVKFVSPNKSKDPEVESTPEITSSQSTITPLEKIENSFKELYDQLSNDLMIEVMKQTPEFFESLVVDLIVKMGYGGSLRDAGRAVGRSNDGGIDGIIKEDRLGLDVIYIQAKRYKNNVPISHIRDFAGALMGKRARKGIFITTSGFPKTAYEYVALLDHKIILIDGVKLAQLMIEFGVGVEIETTYSIKRVNSDYFSEE